MLHGFVIFFKHTIPDINKILGVFRKITACATQHKLFVVVCCVYVLIIELVASQLLYPSLGEYESELPNQMAKSKIAKPRMAKSKMAKSTMAESKNLEKV